MRTVTITICPGPLVHSMDRMSWRNDNGEEGLIFTPLLGKSRPCNSKCDVR